MNVLQHMNQPTGSCYDGSVPLFNKLDDLVEDIAANISDTVTPPGPSHNMGPILQDEPRLPRSPGWYQDTEMYDVTSDLSGDQAVVEPPRSDTGQLPPG